MQDFRELKMFVRDGRKHVEEWIGFLQGHSQLLFLVPVFQGTLTGEENVLNLTRAADVKGVKWFQKSYIYSGDVALLVLIGLEGNRKTLLAHVQKVVEEYHQPGYIVWDGTTAALATNAGQTPLPAFTGSLDSLDELAGHLIPGFKTSGNFDRSMSYVQMRDHQTRPKPGQCEP